MRLGDLVIPVSVGIPTGQGPLWGALSPETPSLCQECSHVPVLLADLHRMIPVPRIQDGLLGVVRVDHGLLQVRGCGLALSQADYIQCLKVNCSPWVTVMLPAYYHTWTPGHWRIIPYLLLQT